MSGKSTEAGTSDLVFRKVEAAEIYPLRYAVLIVGTNRDSPVFPGDELDTTTHFGAFDAETCVACLSVIRSVWREAPAWQMRGMASAPEWRGRGAAMALIAHAERVIGLGSDLGVIWLNAREAAVGFYLKAGYVMDSERFMIENVGPHYRMVKRREMFGKRV